MVTTIRRAPGGPLTVAFESGRDAELVLRALEVKRDARRLMLEGLEELRLQFGAGVGPGEEVRAIEAELATYDRLIRALDIAIYGDPTLALGDHFAHPDAALGMAGEL